MSYALLGRDSILIDFKAISMFRCREMVAGLSLWILIRQTSINWIAFFVFILSLAVNMLFHIQKTRDLRACCLLKEKVKCGNHQSYT